MIKIAEIVVATVEDVMRPGFVRYLRHRLCIMHLSWSNMHESRHLRFYIIEGVHLDAALMLTEFSPLEYRQTKVYSG